MKKFSCLLLSLVMLLSVTAGLDLTALAGSDDFEYKEVNGTVTITKYSGDAAEVEIEDTIDGMAVTAIGSDAFAENEVITSVTIPNTVTSIGARAFYKCTSLESIVLPAFLEKIDNYAFKNCTKAAGDITIPSGVKTIGVGAFENCKSLTRVSISKSVKSIGTDAFNGCENIKTVNYSSDTDSWNSITFSSELSNPTYYSGDLTINGNVVTSVSFGDKVSSVGAYAFINCASLSSVTLLDTVKEDNETKVSGISSIGEKAFYGTSISSVSIPAATSSIGDNAFGNCQSLASVAVDSDNIYYAIDGNGALYDKDFTSLIVYPIASSNTTYTSPSTLKSIPEGAFENCATLQSVNLYDGVTSIGANAFKNCTALKNVILSADIKSIGTDAFSNCPSLESIKVNGTSTDTAKYFASGSDGELYYVKVSDGTESRTLVKYPSANGATTYTAPDTLATVNNNAFENNTTLTSVDLNKTSTIGKAAFKNCTALTDAKINSVATVSESAFENCTSLASVSADSMTLVNKNAFKNCSKLTDIDTSKCTAIGESAFENCSSLTTADLSKCAEIYCNAFKNCSSLSSVTLAKGINTIMENAFDGCTTLASSGSVRYKGLKDSWNKIDIKDGNDALKNSEITCMNGVINSRDTDSSTTTSTSNSGSANTAANSSSTTTTTSSSGSANTAANGQVSANPFSAEESSSSSTVSRPKKTKIKKLKKGKKKITVQWKKVKGVKGYQVQVATNKKFTKNKKSVTVKKQKTTKKTIKKLKSNKKYYVRVRTYKVVNGKKVYSKWSKVKTVKTK